MSFSKRNCRYLSGALYWLVAWFGLSLTSATLAQLPDGGFNPDANDAVYASAVQPDGKLVVAGAFTQIAGQPYQRIARLLVNGQADPSFAPIVIDGNVFAIAVQADGKILIGGAFLQVGIAARNRIARLNADGSLDSGFNPGSGANNSVNALAVQSDGRVLLGGFFTTLNGVARNRIARLNADGALDTSFDPGTGAAGFVYALAVQADGRVLLGGAFTSVNGIGRNGVARLNADGSLDAGFNPGSGTNDTVIALALQTDGRVLLGGFFNTFNGTGRNRIARLNANGTLDAGFNPGTGADSAVRALTLQPDGRVLLGGQFTAINATPRDRIARLNADGTLDAGFNPGAGTNNYVLALAVQADGRVLLGGEFVTVSGIARNRVARLNADGALDNGFDPGSGANGGVYALAVQLDGRALLGGEFTTVNGVARNRIARLNADGALDTTFDPGSGADNAAISLAVQTDGRVLLGGGFTTINGSARNRIARLNAGGTLDAGFASGIGADFNVSAVALQADGRVLLGGSFTTIDGIARNSIARLNTNGSLDTGFDPGSGANGSVTALAVQADGRVLLGGSFTSLNGIARNRIARLNVDGSLDNGFDPGSGANSGVVSVAVQADGRVLLGGAFTTINGSARNRIARLNADGTLDAGFNPGTGADSNVLSLDLQADGRVLLGGLFTTVNGIVRNRIARLNPDGSLDTGFNPGSGANNSVYGLTVQADGNVLLGGIFTTLNGLARNRIARLSTAEAALQALSLNGFDVRWLRGGSSPELSLPPTLAFSVSGNPGTFATLGTMSRIAGGWRLAVPTLPVAQNFFVRAEGVTAGGFGNSSGGRLQSTARLFLSDIIFANGFQ